MKGKVQELVAKEIMSYASKKIPGIVDYNTIWKMKAQLVHGEEFEDKLWLNLKIVIISAGI